MVSISSGMSDVKEGGDEVGKSGGECNNVLPDRLPVPTEYITNISDLANKNIDLNDQLKNNTDGFQFQKTRKRQTITQTNGHILNDTMQNKNFKKAKTAASNVISKQFLDITNKFSPLQTMEEEFNENCPPITEEELVKPKPIFVMTNKVKELLKVLDSVAKGQYTYRLDGDNLIKVLPNTTKIYTILTRSLEKNNVSFHTFQLTKNRSYRVVLKGMHHDVCLNELKEEIEQLKHKVIRIHNVKNRITKQPLNMFFVDLEQGVNNKEIFDIQYLLHAKISFEAPHTKKDVVQCQRCQRYGHSKTYCRHPYRCVKCGQDHPTSSCHKADRSDPAKCVLCDGAHPANYKGCQVYREIKMKKYPSNATPTSSTFVRSPIPPKFTTHNVSTRDPRINYPGRTYANIVKNQTYSSTEQSSHTSHSPSPHSSPHTHSKDTVSESSYTKLENLLIKQAECQARLSEDIRTMLNLLTILISKLG